MLGLTLYQVLFTLQNDGFVMYMYNTRQCNDFPDRLIEICMDIYCTNSLYNKILFTYCQTAVLLHILI